MTGGAAWSRAVRGLALVAGLAALLGAPGCGRYGPPTRTPPARPEPVTPATELPAQPAEESESPQAPKPSNGATTKPAA